MRELPYERVMRDGRINRIFEGTNEVLRLFIALTAMNDVGAQLKELASSLRGVFNDPIKGFGVLSEYAWRRASLATGIGRTKGSFSRLDPVLRGPASVFEDATRDLAAAVDRLLRKHGKNIIEKQLATKRLADIMIDLFVLACALSRVDTALKRSAPARDKEVEIVSVLSGQVRRRVKRNFSMIDDNEDEHVKSLAAHVLEHERYTWDNV
jgi:hypothetical protein